MTEQKTIQQAWGRVMRALEPTFTENDYDNWWKEVAPLRVTGQTLYLRVPNKLTSDWIKQKWGQKLNYLVTQEAAPIRWVDFVTVRKFVPPAEMILSDESLTYDPYSSIETQPEPEKYIIPQSVEALVTEIAFMFEVTTRDVCSKSRQPQIVIARELIMYALRMRYNFSFKAVGLMLGGKDSTTVLYACKRVIDLMETDPTMMEYVRRIEDSVLVNYPISSVRPLAEYGVIEKLNYDPSREFAC